MRQSLEAPKLEDTQPEGTDPGGVNSPGSGDAATVAEVTPDEVPASSRVRVAAPPAPMVVGQVLDTHHPGADHAVTHLGAGRSCAVVHHVQPSGRRGRAEGWSSLERHRIC